MQRPPESPLADTARSSLPPIRPFRGSVQPTGKKPKPLRPLRRPKPRDRFARLFAEFEEKPKPPEKKKKKLRIDFDEDTKVSVLRAEPAKPTETPEQIRGRVLDQYMAGEVPTCPVGCGGIAEVVRVGTLDDGSGDVWIECLSCAQRAQFQIPAASTEERRQANQSMEESGEALCPRHGRPVQLRRRGRDLVCPECGVLFAEA